MKNKRLNPDVPFKKVIYSGVLKTGGRKYLLVAYSKVPAGLGIEWFPLDEVTFRYIKPNNN